MTRSMNEIVGKSIVTADSGEKIGTAADLLLNLAGDQVVAIVIRSGIFSSERVLLIAGVEVLGRDMIVARPHRFILDAGEWHDRAEHTARASTLAGTRVVASDGRVLGAVEDVYINEKTGAVEAFQIGSHSVSGLIARHRVLPRSDGITLGRDVLVVSIEAAELLEPNVAGVQAESRR